MSSPALIRATSDGLLEYRSGHPEEGASAYRRAIEEARLRKLREVEAIAIANFLREQVLAGSVEADFDRSRDGLERFLRDLRNKATRACVMQAASYFTSPKQRERWSQQSL